MSTFELYLNVPFRYKIGIELELEHDHKIAGQQLVAQ